MMDPVATNAGISLLQDYAYDAFGRLSQVDDTYQRSCSTRPYTHDANASRQSLIERASLTAACLTSGAVTK